MVLDFSGSKLNRSVSDDGSYITAVKEALTSYESFSKFKCDPRYTAILEHATYDQGEQCLKIIKCEFPELIKRINDFKENDLEGGPIVQNYEEIGDISPSTLRYIKVASDLKNILVKNLMGKLPRLELVTEGNF